MESHKLGTARAFFDKWFTFITTESRLPRVHDKKLSVLALCALLEVPAEVVPESLKAGWPGIVGGILKIFKGLPKAIEGGLLAPWRLLLLLSLTSVIFISQSARGWSSSCRKRKKTPILTKSD